MAWGRPWFVGLLVTSTLTVILGRPAAAQDRGEAVYAGQLRAAAELRNRTPAPAARLHQQPCLVPASDRLEAKLIMAGGGALMIVGALVGHTGGAVLAVGGAGLGGFGYALLREADRAEPRR